MINLQINRHAADMIMYLICDLDFSSYFKMMLPISIDIAHPISIDVSILGISMCVTKYPILCCNT